MVLIAAVENHRRGMRGERGNNLILTIEMVLLKR
jgi:hypothetical protein